jgi:hypothetical protein
MNRRLFVLAGLALAGCATGPAPATAPPAAPAPKVAPPYGELEPLYAARAGRDGLTLRVNSNGCTAKTDFAFYLERNGEAVQLAFARRKLDTCKSFAQGSVELSFTWAELGVEPRTPVFLLNPLVAWTGPGD